MIELKNISKTYGKGEKAVTAIKEVNITINDGEIFGIIGLSGAGKSTLVRCINFLERPTTGDVVIDGKNLGQLSTKELLEARRNIGMIFQGFNLLEQRTVLKNVCFPRRGQESFYSLFRSPKRKKATPRSFRAVRNSVLRSQGRLPQTRNICSAMKQRAHSTPTPHVPFWSL